MENRNYTSQDYYGITERYVIHEYDMHKKDKPSWYVEKKKEEQENDQPVYDTEELFRDVDYSEQTVLDKLHYPRYEQLMTNVLSLLSTLKYTTETGRYVHAIPISTNNSLNVATVGSQSTMSRTLQAMQCIGLTACVDPTYRHHASNPDKNRCRQYVLNKKMQAVLLDIQKKYNIKVNHVTRRSYLCSPVEVDMNKVKMLYNKIYISSNLHVVNPFKTKGELEKYATYIIQQKYPQYVELVKKAREVNAMPFYLTNYILQVKTTINFKYSPTGILTSIGFRATNRNGELQRQRYSESSHLAHCVKYFSRTFLVKTINLTIQKLLSISCSMHSTQAYGSTIR